MADSRTMSDPDPRALDERIARTEEGVTSLRKSQAELTRTVQNIATNMGDGFERLRESITRDREARHRESKTPWAVIGTFTGVALAMVFGVVSIIGAGLKDDNDDTERDLIALRVFALEELRATRDWQSDHDDKVSGLNASQNARLDDVEEDVLRQDTDIQRELNELVGAVEHSSSIRHEEQKAWIDEVLSRVYRLESHSFKINLPSGVTP